MAQQELLRGYLIVGTDELKRKAALTRLRSRLGAGLEAFNLDERTASADLDAGELLASLYTAPVGPLRLVIVHAADKIPKEASEALIGYLGKPNPSCTLALVADRLAKGTRLYRAIAALGKQAVVDCAPIGARDLPSHVKKLAQAHGIAIDAPAAQELIARVGDTTTMLDTQIALLAELCRGAGVIRKADVEEHIARTAEVKPWPFLDALSARDAAGALAQYRLLGEGQAIRILSLLAGRIRELICARSMGERGTASLLAQELGKADWQVRSHPRWARAFRAGELEQALHACAASDAALKRGGNADQIMIDLIVSICGRGPRPPAGDLGERQGAG